MPEFCDSDPPVPDSVDPTVAHSARVWNYWLGGKDNYSADREAGEQYRAVFPAIVEEARLQRAFLRRAVTYLAGEVGIRQFLDIGTGMPTVNNTHEVAQAIVPESRVVYVDNDPLVLAHATALLTSTPEGSTDYVHADMREPEALLTQIRERLDLTQPTALTVLGTLGHLPDPQAHTVVDHLVRALPAGSYLVVSDSTTTDTDMAQAQADYNQDAPQPYHLRSPEDIAAFFTGLHPVDPGIVPASQWRPDPCEVGTTGQSRGRAGVASKPSTSTPGEQ